MVRPTTLLLIACAALVACAKSQPAATAPTGPPHDASFASDGERDQACLELRDHAVVVFADEWAGEHGVSVVTPEEHDALYNGFTEAMREKGTLDRFARHCALTLTPRRYVCGMASHSSDTLVRCMSPFADNRRSPS